MSYFLFTLIAQVVLAAIPASIARSKGRRYGLWFVYGMLFWLIALIHSLLLPEPAASGNARCPFCGEPVSSGAPACPHCGRALVEAPATSAVAARKRARRRVFPPAGRQFCNDCGEQIGVGQWTVCPVCRSTSLRIEKSLR